MRLKKERKLKLMMILWADHSGTGEWIAGHDLENEVEPVLIHSVGWLVRETEEVYGLASTICERQNEVSNLTNILKAGVVKKRFLRG